MSAPEDRVFEARPGETPGAAVLRLRKDVSGPFRLRHNGEEFAVPDPSKPPETIDFDVREARRIKAENTVRLVGGRFDGVRVGLGRLPDMILVGSGRERYVAVRDPDGDRILCYAWIDPDGGA